MPNGVIFDMDGVLVASGEPHKASWQAVARQCGIELTDEAFERTFGMSSREIVRKIWGPQISDDEVRRIDEEKERVYRRLISGNVPLSPGARETLARLAEAGYVLAVGTSGPPENLELVLRETGLGRYFVVTVNGLEVPRGKPAPDIFLTAAERAGLRSAECVVIEDAPVGIQAALAAGMKAIGYVGTHPAERLREAGAARVIERLAEITPGLVAAVLEGR
jgi:beta-phosphoglucomutase